jgi:hypothetical protein
MCFDARPYSLGYLTNLAGLLWRPHGGGKEYVRLVFSNCRRDFLDG